MDDRSPAKIEVNLVEGELSFVREVASPTSFRDSFNDGPVFRDTFGDGGQWLSSFNNMRTNANAAADLRHPAIRDALQKLRDAADQALAKGG